MEWRIYALPGGIFPQGLSFCVFCGVALTSVKAEMVKAPLIDECFMNLECRFKWEKEIAEGDDYVLMCLEIVSVHIDERHMDENDLGRTEETGILYNIHHPINPEKFNGTAHDYVGIVKKIRDYIQY